MDTRRHQTDTSIASLCKWTYNLPPQSFSIYMFQLFFGIFGEERAMHIAGICWPAIWKSSRRWSTRMDFVGGGLRARFCQVFVRFLFCNCKDKTDHVSAKSPLELWTVTTKIQVTNFQVHDHLRSSSQNITELFLMPNPLSWSLLGKFPISLAINGDPQNCVTWGGFQCGGQTVKVLV